MSILRWVRAMMLVPLAAVAAEDKLKAPAVSVQVVSSIAGGVESGDTATAAVPMALVVTNESERTLMRPVVVLARTEDFEISALALPGEIAPFQTIEGGFALRPRRRIVYGKHDVVLVVKYGWSEGEAKFTSAKSVVASVTVKRVFEDEAKGLPGGTAALFYLLLPVLPAFFAYQIFDRLRRGEGFQFPVFGAEYVLPGFVIGLLVNYFLGARVPRVSVLIAAFAAGALWPLLRWAVEIYQWKRWAFHENDSEPVYLRKALLSRWIRRRGLWVKGTAGKETWSGMLLAQPDGRPVLGARLLISPQQTADYERVKAMVKAVNGAASRKAGAELVRAAEQKKVNVTRLEKVKRGNGDYPDIVAAEELIGFQHETVEKKPLVEFTS